MIKPMPKPPYHADLLSQEWLDYEMAITAHCQSRAEAAEALLSSIFDKDACTCKSCIEPDRAAYAELKRQIAEAVK